MNVPYGSSNIDDTILVEMIALQRYILMIKQLNQRMVNDRKTGTPHQCPGVNYY
jgi:hypothetical protein